MELELRSVEVQGAHEIGGVLPCLVDRVWTPWCISFTQKFLLITKSVSVNFQEIPRTFLFYT